MAQTADMGSVEDVTTTADQKAGDGSENSVEDGGSENLAADSLIEGTPQDEAVSEEEVVESAQEEDANEEVEAETKKEEVPLGKRATERVRQAINRAKDAEAKMADMQAAYERRFESLQRDMARQYDSQQRLLNEQLEYQRAQAEMTKQRHQSEEEAKLTPAQRIERDWLNKAKAEAKKELLPELEGLKKAYAEERRLREQALNAANERRMLNQYKERADNINRNVLLKDFDTEDVAKLSPIAQQQLLTWGTAAGEEPEQAISGLKDFLEAYHQAKLKAVAKKSGAKIKQSQVAPKQVPTGMKAGTNESGKTFKFDKSSGRWGFFRSQ